MLLTFWNSSVFARTAPAVGAILLAGFLAACSSPFGQNAKPSSPGTPDDMKFEKYGKITEDGGALTLFDSGSKKRGAAMLGVNTYLWRAALDTINFMPIQTADSNGGVITTDWYSAPNAPTERVRLNVLIKDQTLRADGVKVTVFRQTLTSGKGGDWRDAEVNPATARQLEDTILQRARQLRLEQEGRVAE